MNVLFRFAQLPRIAAPFAVALSFSVPALTQMVPPAGSDAPAEPQIARLDPVSLPDAPSSSFSSSASQDHQNTQPSLEKYKTRAVPPVASPTDMTIAPGQAGPPQTIRDKFIGSLKDVISPFSLAGEVISAGYSQGVDSSPNYGRDATAFGQRVGASVARGSSQNIFYEGVMASVLHEDPRYYRLGAEQNFVKRVFYSGTRTIVTRTDGGHTTPNFALVSAYLGAAALAQTYYPARNQSFGNVMQTWGTGIGGAAIGYEVTEFLPNVLSFVHLKRINLQ